MRTLQCDLRFVDRLSFSPDGKRLHVFGSRQTPDYHTVLGGRTLLLVGASLDFTCDYDLPDCVAAATSADGKWLATAFRAMRAVQVFLVRTDNRQPQRARKHLTTIMSLTSLAFAPAYPILAVGFVSRLSSRERIPHGVFLWHGGKGRERWRFGTDDSPGEVAFSPDARWLAVGQSRGQCLWLFDRVERTEVCQLTSHDHQRLAFGPRGHHLAAAGSSVLIWDTSRWKRVKEFRGQDEDVPGLAFSPDERILAVARSDGPVEFWDVESGQLRRRYDWNIGRLSAVAFSPDGLTCAIAGTEGRIVVWDVD